MPELDKQSGPSGNGERSQLRVLAYSTCLVEAVTGPGQHGIIHSVFRAAANILFPNGFLLSLNSFDAPRVPNSLQLSTCSGSFPFINLRVGQPVLFGAARLNIEALALSLDLTYCEQWNPKIIRPEQVDMTVVTKNGKWLAREVAALPLRPIPTPTSIGASLRPKRPSTTPGYPQGVPVPWTNALAKTSSSMVRVPLAGTLGWGWGWDENILDVPEMAHLLCGRGPGLTPSGDDILAGWMAINWLLHGPHPHLLAAYQQILKIAERQTHLLSQCWLRYVADGYVAEPIGVLLQALTHENEEELLKATQSALALGATSGRDLIHGILLGLAGISIW